MANFSFDIVSDYDKAEMNNVFDQVQRELQNRYDFKNTPAAVEWLNGDKTGLKITGNGEWQIDAISILCARSWLPAAKARRCWIRREKWLKATSEPHRKCSSSKA